MLIDRITTALWEYQGRVGLDSGKSPSRRWTRDALEEAVVRVNRGAALLDEKQPDWVDRVVPGKLDMSDGVFCIIGQTYGSYDRVGIPFGLEVLNEEDEDKYDETMDDYDSDAIQHGFLTSEPFSEESFVGFPLLDRVWVYMLTTRKQLGYPVTLELPSSEPINKQEQLLSEAELLGSYLDYLTESFAVDTAS